MGVVVTTTKKSFSRDKVGEKLAHDFEKICEVAGMEVSRVEDTQYVTITAHFKTYYEEGDYE